MGWEGDAVIVPHILIGLLLNSFCLSCIRVSKDADLSRGFTGKNFFSEVHLLLPWLFFRVITNLVTFDLASANFIEYGAWAK